MDKNIFHLDRKQIKEIVLSFKEKFEKGLNENDTEIQCLPTYITPKTSNIEGNALVLDLGGTNYRAAIIRFVEGKPAIRPQDGWKQKLDIMKTDGFTREDLFREQTDLISEIDHNQELPIGYCFSYPAESLLNGDAKLLRWTKGVNIPEMIGEPIGQPLMDYMNERKIAKFTSIKVVNDTIASLFAGLTDRGYDAYIGLIVGTGTNMATFVPRDKITKITPEYNANGLIPVNLESGNFHPPHLTVLDEEVDRRSDSTGRQRFEKAVSGMYLGELFKAVFPDEPFKDGFNAGDMNKIINNPELYKPEFVEAAHSIFNRSAQLVASTLAGLVLTMVSFDRNIKRICLTAEGSLFWSKVNTGKHYKDLVLEEVYQILKDFEVEGIEIEVEEKKNINLVGTAIAALS